TTTIDLCLSVFPWAPFRSAKAAAKMHTLLDLRGNIPSFIHISDGKLHEVNVLDQLLPEAGAFYIGIAASPILRACFASTTPAASLSFAPNRISKSNAVTRIRSIAAQACADHTPRSSRASTRTKTS